MKKTRKFDNKIKLIVIIFLIALVLTVGFCLREQRNGADSEPTMSDAVASFDSGDKNRGIEIVENLLKTDPENSEYKNRLAIYYYQAGRADDFLSYVEKNNLNSSTILNITADIYRSKGDVEKAEAYYRRAITASPKSSQLYINFSAFYQAEGNLAKAREVLLEGVAVNTRSTALYISLSSVSLKLDNKTDARKYANSALEIDPANSQAKAIINSL